MSQPDETKEQRLAFAMDVAVEIAVKLGLLFLVLYVSYLIVKPFLPIILWGIILAVAFWPVVESLERRFGNRKRIVVTLTVVAVLALLIPTWLFSDQLIASAKTLVAAIHENKKLIPPPPESVKSWPLVGESLYGLWLSASHDLKEALAPFAPQIKGALQSLVGMLKSALGVVFMTVASVIVAAFLMLSKETTAGFYHKVMRRLLGERGDEWADLSALTVRSVANGVVGVAVVQSLFALVGLVLMGVPLAPLWALAIMFLTIVQLPALIVIAPIIAYVFSYASGTSATIFAVYMVVVGASDGFLKPILMARGVDIPMLVIIIGAIGGMLLLGMIGLFIGAVIFALAYKLFMLWMEDLKERAPDATPERA
ncbi:AI-2E family transporter [Hydrogenimonas sp.]